MLFQNPQQNFQNFLAFCFIHICWKSSPSPKIALVKFIPWKTNETLCAIWYNSNNLKNMKSTYRGKILLVEFRAEACSFTKSNTPTWVFVTFLRWCNDAMLLLGRVLLIFLIYIATKCGYLPTANGRIFFKKNIAFDWYELEVRVKFPDINKGNNWE